MPRAVTLVLGSRKISPDKLRALKQGSVIALEETTDAFITIAADGAVIGKGTLVTTAGKLAVRISSIEVESRRDEYEI